MYIPISVIFQKLCLNIKIKKASKRAKTTAASALLDVIDGGMKVAKSITSMNTTRAVSLPISKASATSPSVSTSSISKGVNEHKPLHVTEAVLNQQASKDSEETIVFLDAYGLTAKIYGMRVFDDIYGCSGPLEKICLPTNKFEMQTFLEGESMELLFRYKEHLTRLAGGVLSFRARTRSRTPSPPAQPRCRTPGVHSPTKRGC
ncbi:hypothetical protein BGZ79_005777, partial [Entomortierella chlamydospora]